MATSSDTADQTTSTVPERILEAAIGVLRESGLRDLKQVRVAEAAGVRQSHLTYYFPRREHLIEAVAERVVEGIGAGVRQALSTRGPADPMPALDRFASLVADLGHMRMFLAMVLEADGDPGLRRIMAEGTHHMERTLADILGGADAAERARTVLAAAWGLGLYAFLMHPAPGADPTHALLQCLAAGS